MNCILCESKGLRDLSRGSVLEGATSRADGVYPFYLVQCEWCGHVQKVLDDTWKSAMSSLYNRDYGVAKIAGRQIESVDGQIVSRDTLAVRKISDLLNLSSAGSLLDIGCGAGRFLAAFASEKQGWQVSGFDVGEVYEEEIISIPRATFYSGQLDSIGRKFDLIALSHVAEHLTEPAKILREAANLLSSNGRIVIRVPCFLSVYPDFFILEHCSHFVPETLAYALSLSGLKITHQLLGLSAIEIGFVAERGEEPCITPNIDRIREDAYRCLTWAQSLPHFIDENANGREFGIFGVGGAGIWLGAYFRGRLSFFVDEDPGKQGHAFAACPIIRPEDVPADAVVFVTLNTPSMAERVAARLRDRNPTRLFIAPPAIL